MALTGAPRRFAVAWLSLALSLCAASPGAASAQALANEVQTTVEGDGRGCVSQSALSRRIVHYLSRTAHVPADLHIHVRAPKTGVTEFELGQAGTQIAVRRFDSLPKTCADRVNAIALAIAVAVEQAALAEPAPPPTAARNEPAVEVAITPPPSAAGTSNSEDTASLSAKIRPDTQPAAAPQSSRKTEDDGDGQNQEAEADAAKPNPPLAPGQLPDNSSEGPRDGTRNDAESNGESADLRFSMHAGGGLMFEVLPAAAVAGVVGGELSFGELLDLRLSGFATAEVESRYDNGSASTQVFGVRCVVCHRLRFAWSALQLCAGVLGGQLVARGDGYYYDNDSERLYWIAALVRAGFRLFDAGPFAMELNLESYVNIRRPSVTFEGSAGPPLELPRLGASSGLEMIFAFN